MTNSKGAHTDQGIVLVSRDFRNRIGAQRSAEELLVNIKLLGLVQHVLRDIESINVGVAEILQDFSHDTCPSSCVEDSEVCVLVVSCFSQQLVEDWSASLVCYVACLSCDLM